MSDNDGARKDAIESFAFVFEWGHFWIELRDEVCIEVIGFLETGRAADRTVDPTLDLSNGRLKEEDLGLEICDEIFKVFLEGAADLDHALAILPAYFSAAPAANPAMKALFMEAFFWGKTA